MGLPEGYGHVSNFRKTLRGTIERDAEYLHQQRSEGADLFHRIALRSPGPSKQEESRLRQLIFPAPQRMGCAVLRRAAGRPVPPAGELVEGYRGTGG